MAAAAASAAAGASVATSFLSVSSETRPRPALVAVAAAAGGIGGFLFWRAVSGGSNGGGSASVSRALRRLDAELRRAPRRPEDVLDEIQHSQEAERFVLQLSGGDELVSPALRLAARAQRLERHAIPRSSYPDGREGHVKWRAALKCRQEECFTSILRKAGVENSMIARACRLLSKDLPTKEDREMQVLEDAACLVFLSHEFSSFQQGKDALKIVDILQKSWQKMSRRAQEISLTLEYEPKALGSFVEAIAVAEGLDKKQSPMVAPRLPQSCIALLRKSWKQVPQAAFCSQFFQRLYEEDSSLKELFKSPIAKPMNVWKVVQYLLDLLDAERVPRLESLAHALAATSSKFGRLRLEHLAAVKRALVRTVTSHAPTKQEKKIVNRAWEAFFYAVTAVSAPHLSKECGVTEVSAATATSLPIPAAGTHAAFIAANGAALLEMSLNMTALSQGGSSAPEEVLAKLREARAWLIDCAGDDINAYCGLLSSVYAQGIPEDPAAATKPGSGTAEETERRLWLRRAAEVPMLVAELATGTASACLSCKSFIKPSLKGDWIAGAKLLRTASEISLKNVVLNLKEMGGVGKAADVEKRMAKMRDAEPPWEDLMDVMH